MARPLRPLNPDASARDFFGAELRRLRSEAGLNLRQLGEMVHYSGATIGAVEKAERWPNPELAKAVDGVLGTEGALTRLLPLVDAQRALQDNPQNTSGSAQRAEVGPLTHDPYNVEAVRRLRTEVNDIVAGEALSGSSLDDWERAVAQHGRATRYKPGQVLLRDLLLDFAELRRLLERPRSASTVRTLTRTAAELAGLVSLTLIKLGQAEAAKEWVRTARLAADEADHPRVRAWVLAQDAYIDYYRGDLHGAIATAEDAQSPRHGSRSVGTALSAALEARAHAALDQRQRALAALGRAEEVLASLPKDSTIPSAFGYNEAQLRFHEGNALTRLGDVERALAAQERALALYPQADYMDRALVRLDQAKCIASSGDLSAAVAHAVATLHELHEHQREGLVVAYARELFPRARLAALPRSTVGEFRELLLNDDHDEAGT